MEDTGQTSSLTPLEGLCTWSFRTEYLTFRKYSPSSGFSDILNELELCLQGSSCKTSYTSSNLAFKSESINQIFIWLHFIQRFNSEMRHLCAKVRYTYNIICKFYINFLITGNYHNISFGNNLAYRDCPGWLTTS